MVAQLRLTSSADGFVFEAAHFQPKEARRGGLVLVQEIFGVNKVMRDLAAEGRTMIVVTHEMGFAREVSNHVLFLHQGRVEEQGHPRDVLSHPQSDRLQQFLSGGLK